MSLAYLLFTLWVAAASGLTTTAVVAAMLRD